MPTIDDELIQNAKAVFKSKVKHSEDVTFDKNVDVSGNLTVNSAANIKDKSLTSADAGKVLTVSEDGSLSWQQKGAGGGMKAFFDAGGKCGDSTATSFDGAIEFTATSDVTDMNNMFSDCSKLTSIPLFNTINVIDMNNMFYHCSSLTSIPSLDTSKVINTSYMFYNCSKLTSVPSLDTSKVGNMYGMFYNCSSLETIHMINIGTDLDIHYSTKFTREALLEIIGNLKTVTTTMTLTMGSTNLAKLTDEDKAIATNKGWTLA